MKRSFSVLLPAALATLLTACGGGTGDASTDGTASVQSRALLEPAPMSRDGSLPCTAATDSQPSSLGADGWAAAGAVVTGGCGALKKNTHVVSSRRELVQALYQGKTHTSRNDGSWEMPDDTPKIIYVRGTIDLNVDDNGKPLAEEDYMKQCGYTAHATYYDPATGNESGGGGFFGAYKAAYDPNLWNRQDAVPRASDGRLAPPPLSGPLEEARACFQKAQERVANLRVGSNTSIIGLGSEARIVRGNLRLGWARADAADPQRPDPANYKATNVVIRNITFEDAYDMFPGWDPQDSFSISGPTSSQPYLADCQARYDAVADKGPHKCRGGRWNAEYDTLSIENAEHVWIDGNTFSDGDRPDKLSPGVWTTAITFQGRQFQIYSEATQKVQHHDGAVDVTLAGTKVTVSWNRFHNHDKTNLLGGSDVTDRVTGYGPGKIDVTFHHNHWQNTVQRMPRVRFGRVHVYNNYYEGTRASGAADYLYSEAWTLGTAAKMYTENNLFDIGGLMDASRLIGFSSTLFNGAGTASAPGRCVQAGFTANECGTWYHDSGTVLNGTAVDVFAAAQEKATRSGSNAPLQRLDPADPEAYWIPGRTYAYTADPTFTGAQQSALRNEIRAKAGAGRL